MVEIAIRSGVLGFNLIEFVPNLCVLNVDV